MGEVNSKAIRDIGFDAPSVVCKFSLDLIKLIGSKNHMGMQDQTEQAFWEADAYTLAEVYGKSRFAETMGPNDMLSVHLIPDGKVKERLQQFISTILRIDDPRLFTLVSCQQSELDAFIRRISAIACFYAWDYLIKLIESGSLTNDKLKAWTFDEWTSFEPAYIYSLDKDSASIPRVFKDTDDPITAMYTTYALVKSIFSGKINESTTEEASVEALQVHSVSNEQRYIEELKARGYARIGDNTVLAGATNRFSYIMSWLKDCSKIQHGPGMFKSVPTYTEQQTISDAGFTPESADIWKSEIYTLSEALRFRIFVRETDISYTMLIKLPVGLEVSDFEFDKNKQPKAEAIVHHFYGNDNKGIKRMPCLLRSPEMGILASMEPGIHTVQEYPCVRVTLSKDLLSFKKANWGLLDYIDACHGIQNDLSGLTGLTLGSEIVVGARPDSLKNEMFDCSGRHNTSGIIGGQAGSGKTALFDSLLVQFVALTGKYGDGAVVLLDAKDEWVSIWKTAFESLGVPFYGFGASTLKYQNELKYVDAKGKIKPISEPITQEIAGIFFMKAVYAVIQSIQKAAGASDVSKFNEMGANIGGITRLPRTAILVDEINTFNANASGSVARAAYTALVGGANLTRTSGYMWLIGGQNPSKSIIESKYRTSFGYNIFGSMDAETYEYHGVTVSEAVEKYESMHRTPTEAHPIVSQGVFYAGPRGATELVKCLYLPEDKRKTALERLNSSFDGMRQFDAIVRYALSNGYFDREFGGFSGKHNMIYAVLAELGVISEQEFIQATARLFGSDDDISSGPTDDGDVDTMGSAANQQDTYTIDSDDSSSSSRESSSQAGNSHFQSTPPPVSPNRPKKMPFEKPYTEPITIEDNPFDPLKGAFWFDSMYCFSVVSSQIMDEICRVFGGYDRIRSLYIADSGLLVINNVPFQPSFDDEFISLLPIDLKGPVSRGNIAELFYFRRLRKFKNLVSLTIENPVLAESRVRPELELDRIGGWFSPKGWPAMFRIFPYLKELNIAGQVFTDETTADKYESSGRGGFDLKSKLSKAFGVGASVGTSWAGKLWNSNPATHVKNALLTVMGVKACVWASCVLGPIGVVFSAAMIYSVGKSYKKSLQESALPNKASSTSSSKKSSKKTKKK